MTPNTAFSDNPTKVGYVIRGITPAGVVAVLVATISGFSGINDALDRNCNATRDVSAVLGAVVSVDNELSSDDNAGLRRQLNKELHNLPRCNK